MCLISLSTCTTYLTYAPNYLSDATKPYHKPPSIFLRPLPQPTLLTWSLLPVCQAKRPYGPAAYIQMNLNP